MKPPTNKDFQALLTKYFKQFKETLATENDDWTVKGFIDVFKNIYTISVDTKVVSKIVELMIFPIILRFSKENGYKMILSSKQNHYPDITFEDNDTGERIALDLKSTYRISPKRVNGMTLGAFTGYFRNRASNKNITYPYNTYSQHFILGVIYTQTDLYEAEKVLEDYDEKVTNTKRELLVDFLIDPSDSTFEQLIALLPESLRKNDKKLNELRNKLAECVIDERESYTLTDLKKITSVVRDFEFFVQEKWRISIDRPGSGNTKNIGSTPNISELINGTAVFTKYEKGKQIFDDFWVNYLTKDMAKAIDLEERPYTNLASFATYKGIKLKEIDKAKGNRK